MIQCYFVCCMSNECQIGFYFYYLFLLFSERECVMVEWREFFVVEKEQAGERASGRARKELDAQKQKGELNQPMSIEKLSHVRL